ncbi:MAG: hypothetical protein AB7N80_09705 [Bdellovibrionales bacterium]
MIEEQLRVFVVQSGIDFRTLGMAIGESTRFVMQWWNKHGEIWLSDRHIGNLSAFLDVTPEQLLTQQIPVEELRTRFIEGPTRIEERYFVNAFSKVRTTAHIVRYLSLRFGRANVDNLLRQMGVHPCIYSSLDNKINIDFFIQLLEKVKSLGLAPQEISQLGCYMFLGVSGTELGSQFAQARNYAESYQVLNSNFHNFDRNFIYDVHLDDEGFEMTIHPGEVLQKKIQDENTDCAMLALYRKYMMCWFPYLSGLPPVSGNLVKSLAYGDDHCVLRAKFPTPQDRPRKATKPPLVLGG